MRAREDYQGKPSKHSCQGIKVDGWMDSLSLFFFFFELVSFVFNFSRQGEQINSSLTQFSRILREREGVDE